jgi:hypothetical protein
MTKIQITETEDFWVFHMVLFGSLEHSIFEFVSYFDIRISDLETPISKKMVLRGYPKAGSLSPDSLISSGHGLVFFHIEFLAPII